MASEFYKECQGLLIDCWLGNDRDISVILLVYSFSIIYGVLLASFFPSKFEKW